MKRLFANRRGFPAARARPWIRVVSANSRSPLSNGDNVTCPQLRRALVHRTNFAPLPGRDRRNAAASDLNFRMAVQWVNRPSQDFRGYCGRVASGKVKVGDRVRVTPGGIGDRNSIYCCVAVGAVHSVGRRLHHHLSRRRDRRHSRRCDCVRIRPCGAERPV